MAKGISPIKRTCIKDLRFLFHLCDMCFYWLHPLPDISPPYLSIQPLLGGVETRVTRVSFQSRDQKRSDAFGKTSKWSCCWVGLGGSSIIYRKTRGLPCAACVCIREYSSMYTYNYNIIRSLCILYIKITRATAQFLSILYCICGQMAARRSVNQMTQQGGRRSRNISCPSFVVHANCALGGFLSRGHMGRKQYIEGCGY
jgi:hypothetical protein